MTVPTPPDPGTDAAVERVRARLAALPTVPMPPDVADRIGARLADAGTSPARRRVQAGRPAVRAVLLAGIAAATVAVTVTLAATGPTVPRPAARDDALRAAAATAFGHDGAGPLADPVRRRACLAAAGIADPDAALLGGVPYAVADRPGTLLLLGSGVRGRYRLVVVDPGCGPGGGEVLASAVAGR